MSSTDTLESRVSRLERVTLPQARSTPEYAAQIEASQQASIAIGREPARGYTLEERQARSDRNADLLGIARTKVSIMYGFAGMLGKPESTV